MVTLTCAVLNGEVQQATRSSTNHPPWREGRVRICSLPHNSTWLIATVDVISYYRVDENTSRKQLCQLFVKAGSPIDHARWAVFRLLLHYGQYEHLRDFTPASSLIYERGRVSARDPHRTRRQDVQPGWQPCEALR